MKTAARNLKIAVRNLKIAVRNLKIVVRNLKTADKLKYSVLGGVYKYLLIVCRGRTAFRKHISIIPAILAPNYNDAFLKSFGSSDEWLHLI